MNPQFQKLSNRDLANIIVARIYSGQNRHPDFIQVERNLIENQFNRDRDRAIEQYEDFLK